MKNLRRKQGFTLIEVVVVMAIIAVLAVLVVGAIIIARNSAKETTHRSNGKTVQTALESYYTKNKRYPATTGTVSFAAALTATGGTPANDLASTPECAAAGARDGGGTVTYAASTPAYTIKPADAACSADLPAADQIKGP